jgi:hypothetical protein
MFRASSTPSPAEHPAAGASQCEQASRGARLTRSLWTKPRRLAPWHNLGSESGDAACRAECARRGLQVAALYSDNGYSGGTVERPALTELRAAVAAGEVAAVIVYAVDRLSRKQSDTLMLLEQFSDAGAGLIAASQPFETAWLQEHRDVTLQVPTLHPDRYDNGRDAIANALKAAAPWSGSVYFGDTVGSVRFGSADVASVQRSPGKTRTS